MEGIRLMISPINSSLNAYLASFSELSRTSALHAQTRALPVEPTRRITPEQLREQPEIAQDVLSERGKQNQARFGLPDERRPSFADFTKPRALIAPSDEAQLFAAANEVVSEAIQISRITTESSRQADFAHMAHVQQEQATQSQLSLRRQSYVAQLYAQTNDITFSNDHVVDHAA